MFRSISVALLVSAVAFAAVGEVESRAATPYTLAEVTQITGDRQPNSRLSAPAVNDSGTVVYGLLGVGVFLGVPGDVTQLQTPGLSANDELNSPILPQASISGNGTIAFTALPPNPQRFVGSAGVYVSRPDGTQANLFPARQAQGEVIGLAVNDGGQVGVGIFGSSSRAFVVEPDGSQRSIVTTAGSVASPHLNAAGELAVVYGLASPRFRVGDRLEISIDSPVYQDRDFPVLNGTFAVRQGDWNDTGRVAFAARWGSFEDAIYTEKNGVISKVTGSGAGDAVPLAPAINDADHVAALIADAAGGSTRISVYEDGVENPIASVGDAFLGSTITGLHFKGEGFNDADQLAFIARLADGRSAVVLASPVPEPVTLGLAFPAILWTLRRRRA